MRLTSEQLKSLEPYEKHFKTAIVSRYAKYPGATGIKLIHEVYSSIEKTAPALNTSCSICIFRLLVDMGTIYFADKEEAEQQQKPKRKKK